MGMVWQPEFGEACHLASTVRKQRDMTTSRCIACFLLPSSPWNDGFTILLSSLLSPVLSENILTDTPRGVSVVMLNSIMFNSHEYHHGDGTAYFIPTHQVFGTSPFVTMKYVSTLCQLSLEGKVRPVLSSFMPPFHLDQALLHPSQSEMGVL